MKITDVTVTRFKYLSRTVRDADGLTGLITCVHLAEAFRTHREMHGGGAGNLHALGAMYLPGRYRKRGLLLPFIDRDDPPPWLNTAVDPMDVEGFVHISPEPGLSYDVNWDPTPWTDPVVWTCYRACHDDIARSAFVVWWEQPERTHAPPPCWSSRSLLPGSHCEMPNMDCTLPPRIRGRYGASPRARRAYRRLRGDASIIVHGLTLAVREVRFLVACIVDSPTKSPNRQR